MTKTYVTVLLSLTIVAATGSACATTELRSGAGSPSSSTPATTQTLAAQQLDDGTFCQAARQAGITNTALMTGGADPNTLLPALDQLLPSAPASIRDDFTTFVHLEHAMLDPAHSASPAQLNQPGTRDALAHVADYLKNTCHIT
jgi:hypothetical protein